jgi:hypothetical protein
LELKQIAEWLRENGYKTVRGKRFYGNHVFSILKRMRQRQERITKKHPLEYGPLSIKLVDHTKSYEKQPPRTTHERWVTKGDKPPKSHRHGW